MKRMLSLITVFCLCLSLCACGRGEVVALDSNSSAPVTTPEVQALDWDAAYAVYEPGEPIFTVGSQAVTWQELFYQVAYCTRSLEYTLGEEITDWSLTITDSSGNTVYAGDYILQTAVSLLQQYHAVEQSLLAEGLVLDEQALAQVEAIRADTVEDSFGGDEEAFRAYLESLYGSEEIWTWLCTVDVMYNEGLELLYGPMGQSMEEEAVLAYGEDYSYVNTRQIYIYNNTDQQNVDAGSDLVPQLLAELESVKEDPAALEACFAALAEQYNENPVLETYPEGWCIWPGDTEEAVYQAALALEDNSYTVVALEGADVLVLRMPLTAEAEVYYNSEEGQMYDLRYYAAWQAYTDRINGTGGWLDACPVQALSGFESLNLQDLFAGAQK